MNWEKVNSGMTEPFAPHDVQWRAGSVSRDKKRAQALAYAEPRVYEDRLNNVLGANWECTFEPWGEQRLTCTLTIWLTNEEGKRFALRRSSTGEFDSSDRVAMGTSAEAQSFKRACSKFGLGRYLYDLPASWVGYDENSRRLTETPTLPRNALPQRDSEALATPGRRRLRKLTSPPSTGLAPTSLGKSSSSSALQLGTTGVSPQKSLSSRLKP